MINETKPKIIMKREDFRDTEITFIWFPLVEMANPNLADDYDAISKVEEIEVEISNVVITKRN